MTQVVPAIIPKTKEQMEEEIKEVSGFAKLIQIDISDGVFTPFKTWPYNGRDTEYFDMLKNEEEGWPRWEDVDFEVHLMIKNPEESISDWIHTGAVAIIVHIESTEHIDKVIDACRASSLQVGLAIKPSTNLDRIKPFAEFVDFIQVMGSDLLGKHGEELDEKAVDKIKEIRHKYGDKIIAVDIGVNQDTKGILIDAGANKLVSGSDILEADDPEEEYNNLAY